VTLCKVENNVPRGMELLGFGIEPSSNVDALAALASRHTCRDLCANCIRIAKGV